MTCESCTALTAHDEGTRMNAKQCHHCGKDFNWKPFLGTITEHGRTWHPYFCSGECRFKWAVQQMREPSPLVGAVAHLVPSTEE